MRRTLVALGALALIQGCAPTVETHGHVIPEDRLAAIDPGVSTRLDVARILGSPSALSTFDSDRWLYISQRTERTSFYQAEITEQDVVAIAFDPRGFVAEIERIDMASAMAIDPEDAETATAGNELTFLQQLVGNIGRFNPIDTDGRSGVGGQRQGSAARR